MKSIGVALDWAWLSGFLAGLSLALWLKMDVDGYDISGKVLLCGLVLTVMFSWVKATQWKIKHLTKPRKNGKIAGSNGE